MSSRAFATLCGLFFVQVVWGGAAGDEGGRTTDWFEGNRVQAHFENGIQEDLEGLYKGVHGAIRGMGASVLTRIFKTTEEGAWWPTSAGRTHEALAGRDLGAEMARDAHERGLKVFAYYRIMCDAFIEEEHPGWLCRDAAGKLVVEPRTRRRAKPTHVICFNSPAREFTRTRLIELADRGVDGIYFDSWHMPEICACVHCRAAFEKETGAPMNPAAGRGTEEYRRISAFVGRTIVRTFAEWKAAVREKHPGVMFAIGSSLYPCFDTQMQITADLLRISDTSKTEFSKPFGGHLRAPAAAGVEGGGKRGGFMDESFAIPAYDVQNALGWSFTRDSCEGRPPLMWIPFTRTEEEALFSSAAAVSYGCVASIHPVGLWERRAPVLRPESLQVYKRCYEMGAKVSPALAGARPLGHALIHISARSRDARIADPRGLWTGFFAPVLVAFEALKEEHVPVATIDDPQLEQGVPAGARVLVLPCEKECSEPQRSAVQRFESAGGKVVRLDGAAGWHLKSEKERLKREVLERSGVLDAAPPIRARGPAGMHAVFHREAGAGKTVVCLVNAFGWFRSEREGSADGEEAKAPPACAGVSIEIGETFGPVRRAVDVLSGKELALDAGKGGTRIRVPDFAVMACVAIE